MVYAMPMRKSASSGFTLIEVMITLAIIGIAMAIAIPSMQTLLNNQKMKSASFDLVTTVMQARSEAMKWGAPSGGIPEISMVASAGGLSDGWCVTFTSASICDVLDDASPGPDVMLANKATAKITYSALPKPIVFGHSGRLLSDAAFAAAPVRILVKDTEEAATARCVVIDSNGNPRTYVQLHGDHSTPTFEFFAGPPNKCTCASPPVCS